MTVTITSIFSGNCTHYQDQQDYSSSGEITW